MTDQATEVPVIARSVLKQHRLWDTCERLGQPYIVVLKHRKYARFRYDMLTTDRRLSEETVRKIQELCITFFQNNTSAFSKKSGLWGAGSTYGFSPDMEIAKIIELAGEVAKIVRDPKNHISRGGGAAMNDPKNHISLKEEPP
jgi:hypothetical protein